MKGLKVGEGGQLPHQGVQGKCADRVEVPKAGPVADEEVRQSVEAVEEVQAFVTGIAGELWFHEKVGVQGADDPLGLEVAVVPYVGAAEAGELSEFGGGVVGDGELGALDERLDDLARVRDRVEPGPAAGKLVSHGRGGMVEVAE